MWERWNALVEAAKADKRKKQDKQEGRQSKDLKKRCSYNECNKD